MEVLTRLTRRAVLGSIARASGVAALFGRGILNAQPATPRREATRVPGRWDVVVVGAGVFGAWTAWHLRRQGQRVLLLDAWGAANARASSGGESRMTRTAYGKDELYTRMAWESLPEWRWLSERSGLPIFHPLGVLFFFARMEPYMSQTVSVHERLGLPLQILDRAELQKRFPQFNWNDIETGLYEPEFGALMARRAVQTLVARFTHNGGEYRLAAVEPPRSQDPALAPERGREQAKLGSLVIAGGERLYAERYVFACGPWLPKLFPDVLGRRIFVTRQEVFFFAPPSGDVRFAPGRMPGWADFNQGDIYYGFPDLEARGVKLAHDKHGPVVDPDMGDRQSSAAALAEARAYLGRRFPALVDRPLNEVRVCQYENSSSGDFLIDRHPDWQNVWLVGGGSGHGFKHGPAVGHYAAQLIMGQQIRAEPRFSLATKGETQQRAVR